MYEHCPKCGHPQPVPDTNSADVCANCGLVFSKWLKNRYRSAEPLAEPEVVDAGDSLAARIKATLFYIPERTDPVVWWGRVVLYVVFLIWGWSFILMSVESNEIGRSFMHNINLVFHEAGHVLFRPFGRFMTILGGSLAQLLVPLIVGIALLYKNADTFGASVGLWWFAQSLMDLAPYIGDARAGRLMLLGGVTGQDMPGIHDWRNILSQLDLLQHDRAIAAAVDMMGQVLMLLSFLWGAWILRQQHRTKGRY